MPRAKSFFINSRIGMKHKCVYKKKSKPLSNLICGDFCFMYYVLSSRDSDSFFLFFLSSPVYNCMKSASSEYHHAKPAFPFIFDLCAEDLKRFFMSIIFFMVFFSIVILWNFCWNDEKNTQREWMYEEKNVVCACWWYLMPYKSVPYSHAFAFIVSTFYTLSDWCFRMLIFSLFYRFSFNTCPLPLLCVFFFYLKVSF